MFLELTLLIMIMRILVPSRSGVGAKRAISGVSFWSGRRGTNEMSSSLQIGPYYEEAFLIIRAQISKTITFDIAICNPCFSEAISFIFFHFISLTHPSL